ncbi:MAG: toprim domain-containing protein [Thermoplasmata archaeon]
MTEGHLPRDPWPPFVELFAELRRESLESGTVVLVEGERDRSALRRLGVEGRIVLVHHGATLAQLAHELERPTRRVIVFTDWDSKGGHLARRIREFLGGDRVELDENLRRRFARLLRGEVVHVEGLARWARRMAERSGGSLEHYLAEDPG